LYTTPTFTVILLFVFLIRPPPRSTLFPYTTLFRSTLPADFTKLEANKQIIENFNTYGRDPDGAFTIPAYAAVQILTQSIEAVGEDADAVADYMHENAFDTAIGKVEYDEKGDLKHFEFAVYQWDKSGEFAELE